MRIPRKRKSSEDRGRPERGGQRPKQAKRMGAARAGVRSNSPKYTRAQITIDGPVSCGKSALARKLARRIGGVYLNSGAIYRTIALHAQRAGLSTTSELQIEGLIDQLRFSLVLESDGQSRLCCNDVPIGDEVEPESIAQVASIMASQPGVRSRLTAWQRDLLEPYPSFVLEGRDAGTIVFPYADVKFFVECPLEDRIFMCRHRLSQRTGRELSEAEVRDLIVSRDTRDIERDIAPLVMASDGILIANAVNRSNHALREMTKIVHERLERFAS
jgi:cytidylate kinase